MFGLLFRIALSFALSLWLKIFKFDRKIYTIFCVIGPKSNAFIDNNNRNNKEIVAGRQTLRLHIFWASFVVCTKRRRRWGRRELTNQKKTPYGKRARFLVYLLLFIFHFCFIFVYVHEERQRRFKGIYYVIWMDGWMEAYYVCVCVCVAESRWTIFDLNSGHAVHRLLLSSIFNILYEKSLSL